jgi:tetratricopeptide (TPR) repeat protein
MFNFFKNKFKKDQKMIEATNEKGETVFVSKKKWRNEILPKNLKTVWNDAQKLSDEIAYALQDGFAAELLEASEHLLKIDTLPERSYVLRALVFFHSGKISEAKKILEKFHNNHQKTAASVINYAKILLSEGQKQEAENLIFEGLEIDPNVEEGLKLYSAIAKERFGEEGYKKSLEKVCQIKNSWRAYLWLGRYELQQKNKERAFNIYNNFFRLSEERDRALLMMSADLGQNEMINEIIELIAPRYVVKEHDPRIGFNLLFAFKQKNDVESIRKLVEEMSELDRFDVEEELKLYEKYL